MRIAIAAARGFALVTGAQLFGTDRLTVMAKAAWRAGMAGDGSPSPSRSMRGAGCSISGSMTPPAASSKARF